MTISLFRKDQTLLYWFAIFVCNISDMCTCTNETGCELYFVSSTSAHFWLGDGGTLQLTFPCVKSFMILHLNMLKGLAFISETQSVPQPKGHSMLQWYLDYGRILWQSPQRLSFRWLANVKVLDITAAEDDVLKDLISRWNWSISWAVLCPKRTNWNNKAWFGLQRT